ncbi:MAG: hypothetical protein KDA87_10720 [Planctomycetales bacterium]|nr:hypothetical protein [Planctomycetales bacterium]
MKPLESFLLITALQVTVISTLGLLLLRIRISNPSARHSIALAVLLLVLFTPILVSRLPPRRQDFTLSAARSTSKPTTVFDVATPNPVPSVPDRQTTEPSPRQPNEITPREDKEMLVTSAEPVLSPASPIDYRPRSVPARNEVSSISAVPGKEVSKRTKNLRNAFVHIARSLPYIWLLGTIIALVNYIRSLTVIRSLKQTLVIASLPEAVTSEFCRRIRIRSMPKVFESNRLGTPAVVGVIRPVIVLPNWFVQNATQQQMIHVLTHEYAHILRSDMWPHLLQQLMGLLYWWHPLVRSVSRHLTQAREELCDNFVLQDSRATEYAEDLLCLAEKFNGTIPFVSLLGFFPQRWSLRMRIYGLLNPRRNKMYRNSKGWFVLSLFLAVSFLLIGGIASPVPSLNAEQNATPQESDAKSTTDGATEPEPMTATMSEEGAAGDLRGYSEPGAVVQSYVRDDDGKYVLAGETTTNEEGEFTISPKVNAGERTDMTLVAKKAGFATVRTAVNKDNTKGIELDLEQPAVLSGRIIDSAGFPVSNATVYRGPGEPIPGIHTATTDKDGDFRIVDLTQWQPLETSVFTNGKVNSMVYQPHLLFTVSHPDYADTLIKCTSVPGTMDITLPAPAIVEGQVVDLVTGQPVPNAEVRTQGIAEHGWATTRADGDGKYRFLLTHDYYNIWAVVPDRMPLAIKALEAVPGKRVHGANIQMTKGGFIEGRIIDMDGNSLNGEENRLYVAHHGPARPMTGAAVASTPVHTDGTYKLHVAPGRNYVYLMNSDSAIYLNVGDGNTVEHDFLIGEVGDRNAVYSDPDYRLRNEIIRDTFQRLGKTEVVVNRSFDTVDALLRQLDEMNKSSAVYSDEWAELLHKLAGVGPDGLPQLTAELDRTDDDRMLRCLGFALRAIGDKRAVPALIRSIPKTLQTGNSDMGLQIQGTDKALLTFMQKHDLDDRNEGVRYGFGRPVREIFGALRSLTDQDFGEEELFHIFLNQHDSQKQKHAKAQLFYSVATKWTDWWEKNGRELVGETEFQSVRLSPLSEPDELTGIAADAPLKSRAGTSNWILESVARANSGHVFYDLDTGRVAAIPLQWRKSNRTPDENDAMRKWAAENRFDIMGDEVTLPDSQTVFVLRPLELKVWQMPKSAWKASFRQTTFDSLRHQGTLHNQNVLVTVAATGETDLRSPGTFLFETKDGTIGLLYVGVEVHDNSLKPGDTSDVEDDELNLIGFVKGRRFGLAWLVPLD